MTLRRPFNIQCCGIINLNNDQYKCKNSHSQTFPIQLKNPVGLPNFSNNCYLSSILQALLNVSEFSNDIVDACSKIGKENKFNTLRAYGMLIINIRKKKKGEILESVKRIKSCLEEDHHQFRGSQYGDAMEVFEIIIGKNIIVPIHLYFSNF